MNPSGRIGALGGSLLSGLCAGLLLASVRAPAGLEPLAAPAALGFDAAAVRCLAWLALALALVLAGSSPRHSRGAPVTWLIGAASGWGIYLLMSPLLAPTSRFGLLGRAAVLATFSGLAWRYAAQQHAEQAQSASASDPLPERRELLGLLLLACAASVCFEALTRPLRRLGLGLESDDLAIGQALVLAVVAGAIAFGGLGRGLARCAWYLAAVPALAGVNWLWLGRFDDPIALERFIRRLGLSMGSPGSLPWHLALAGGALLLPSLALGAALAGLQHARALGALALGAALGTLVSALALDAGQQRLDVEAPLAGLASHGLLARGAWMALLGALLALWPRDPRPTGWLRLATALGLSAVLLLRPPAPHLLTPLKTPARGQPLAVLENSLGLLAIEEDANGQRCLTLDGRRLTPGPEQRRSDLWQISFALSALDRLELRREAPRVLLIGLLTPERERLLATRTNIDLERSGPWYQSAAALEALLYAAGAPQLGRLVDPADARAKIERGGYDLVIAPANYGVPLMPTGPQDRSNGPARLSLAHFELPSTTAGLFWFSAEGPLAAQELGERVLLASDGLAELCAASLAGAAQAWPADVTAGFPGGYAAGSLLDQWPWQQLLTDPRERARRWQTAWGERLAAAGEPGPRGDLLKALELHARAQAPSAPWEDRISGTELDQGCFELLGPVATELGQDPFVHQLIEGAAALATYKRRPDWLINNFGPAATRHAPWPALSEALARADLELLDGASALARLDVVLGFEPRPFELRLLRVRALSVAGQAPAAAAALRELLAEGQSEPARRRDLALTAAELRLPEAEDLLQAALRLFPGDQVLSAGLLKATGIDPLNAEMPPADAIGPPATGQE